MVAGSYIPIITLNVHGLNATTKVKVWLNGYKNETSIYTIYKRFTPGLGTHTDCKLGAGKRYPMHWKSKESRSSNTHIRYNTL